MTTVSAPTYEEAEAIVARARAPLGGIVGSVEIVDCVRASSSPWFVGDFGFVLRNPKILPFHPCRGQLGFFDVAYPEAAP